MLKKPLKSNMDRFIAHFLNANLLSHIALKSNMDRFIVVDEDSGNYALIALKSNMDRFIGGIL